jgi:hypothetical protein
MPWHMQHGLAVSIAGGITRACFNAQGGINPQLLIDPQLLLVAGKCARVCLVLQQIL